MKKWLTLIFIAMLVLLISACNGNDDSKEDSQNNNDETREEKDSGETDTNDSNKEISVKLNDVDGNKAAEATLTQVDDGVKVNLVGDGLPEEKAKHGFHVHEKGICEPRDFESAGGHYNPVDKKHGKEDVDGKHAGDFDNIEVDSDGEVIDVEFTTDQISLDEDADNTVFTEDGTSLVIHDGPDDYKSQPSGDAGARIACGVIAEPK